MLENAGVILGVDLAQKKIRIQELLSLRKGDILPLDRVVEAPVAVKVSGLDKYRGLFGARKGKKAVKILSAVTNNEEPSGQDDGMFEVIDAEAI